MEVAQEATLARGVSGQNLLATDRKNLSLYSLPFNSHHKCVVSRCDDGCSKKKEHVAVSQTRGPLELILLGVIV